MDGRVYLIYIAFAVVFILFAVYSTTAYRKMSNNMEELKIELAKANFRVYLLEKKEKIFREQKIT
jgi:hypothetical protein